VGALLCGPPVLCCPDGAAWESMVINLGSFGICSASFVAFVEYANIFWPFLTILRHFILFYFVSFADEQEGGLPFDRRDYSWWLSGQ
jgi:hypothetical protein